MKNLIVVMIVYSLSLAGCVSSSVMQVKMNIGKEYDVPINIMPFHLAKNNVGTKSKITVIGSYYTSTIDQYYVFDNTDYMNLRTSLLKSLSAEGSFLEVIDALSFPDMIKENAFKLYIIFSQTAINYKAEYTECIIGAEIRLLCTDGSARNSNITVTERSYISVSSAKNGAIKQFIEKIAVFLQSTNEEQIKAETNRKLRTSEKSSSNTERKSKLSG